MDFLKYRSVMLHFYPTLSYGFTDTSFLWVDTEIPKPNIDELWEQIKKDVFMEQIRTERNVLLNDTDKYMVSDWSFPKKDEYVVYRQSLRDLPPKYEELMSGTYDYKDHILKKDGVDYNFFPSQP